MRVHVFLGLNLGLNKCSKLHENSLKQKSTYIRKCFKMRVENGTQTCDPQLGRLVLYRLSYFRNLFIYSYLQSCLYAYYLFCLHGCLHEM